MSPNRSIRTRRRSCWSRSGAWEEWRKSRRETLRRIHDTCRKHGTFLIFDEVQTGIGRTGSFLYAGTGGIYPEMVTLAKGIASGVPASALLVTREVADQVALRRHGSDLRRSSRRLRRQWKPRFRFWKRKTSS